MISNNLTTSVAMPTALIAEDSRDVQEALFNLLSDAGYQVAVADDGQEALEILMSVADPFRLIVTDYRMPRLNGLDLIRKIIALKLEYGKIILFTAEDRNEPGILEFKKEMSSMKSVFIEFKGEGFARFRSLLKLEPYEKIG